MFLVRSTQYHNFFEKCFIPPDETLGPNATPAPDFNHGEGV